MESGYVTRIGDVIIQRVGPPTGPTSPQEALDGEPPPEENPPLGVGPEHRILDGRMGPERRIPDGRSVANLANADGRMALDHRILDGRMGVEHRIPDGCLAPEHRIPDGCLAPELDARMVAEHRAPLDLPVQGPMEQVEDCVTTSSPIDASSIHHGIVPEDDISPDGVDHERMDEYGLDGFQPPQGVPPDIDDDIVPDFPEDDLNEDNTPDDDAPNVLDDLAEEGPHDGDTPPHVDDIEEGDDVLAGLKGGADGVALMESEDLLREIKPEPMEHDEPEDDDGGEHQEEGDEDLGDEELKNGESSKRKQESDTEEENANKKKKSEEESESEKKKNNAINFRRNIREVMDENQLDEATLAAQRQEAERLRRVQDQQKYLREMQHQRQMQMQKNRAARMLSILQGGSGSASILKTGQSFSPQMAGQSGSSKPNTVVVKLGSGGPPQLLNKKVLEAIRGKSSPIPQDSRSGLNRMMSKAHMVTPSVTIAPVKPAAAMADTEKKGRVTPDVVTISSSDEDDDDDDKPSQSAMPCDVKIKEEPEDDDDDCIVISEPSDAEEEEEDVDTNNSGMHTNDLFNCPDEQGRVLINVGKQEGEQEIFLAPQVSRVIKPHQIGGVRFLFDNIIESAERYKTSTGFGCILAHSMGLGKTLQVVSFCDVFLRETPGRTIMCIMPINTLQNWMAEFNMWLPMDPSTSPLAAQGEVRPRDFQIFVLNDLHKTIASRARVVAEWQREGGVLLIGYEMYRQLSLRKGKARKGKKKNPEEDFDDVKNKPHLENMHEALVKPGPDLVICDEGHRIKNSHASISHALKQIRTKRRVVLTGYPLQNNLLEYWCMVDFVRPNYLGTKTEFSNMFERPIQNGQCIDSTPQDIRLMRYRAHVLHSLLEGFVQRRSHSVLRNSLPQKEEYVLLVRMNDFQRKLYDTFMNEVVRTKAVPNPLKAFAVCCKIWNHPDILYHFLKKRELDELQDLELEETANLNPNQPPPDPNSPRRGGEMRGKKGKGSKKAPAVPIKPAATVPPTTAQPEVKSEGQNTNFEFSRDSQQNFGGPPPQQGDSFNGPPPQGDFNNFNPNFRGSGYYQNYNPYPNFPQEGGYNYGGEYNNYNNYYQGGGSYGSNFYPQIKKEQEDFTPVDKKEEIKFSQPKSLSGGQVVYNPQFGPGQFETKKEFQPFNEWNQFGQQNYGGFNWQEQQGDQKPPKAEPEGMQSSSYPQQSGFPPQPNADFQPPNYVEQSTTNIRNIQNGPNFVSNQGFSGQQGTVPQSPAPSPSYQQPGFSGQSNPQSSKPGFSQSFENQHTPTGSNPNQSSFPPNFGSQSSTSQINQQGFPQDFNQPQNAQSGSSQLNTQAPQNFGPPSVSNGGNAPNQPVFNSNFVNQQPCGNTGFSSQSLSNHPNNASNPQGYQQSFENGTCPNPGNSFQQNFGGHSNTSTYGSLNTVSGSSQPPSNFPPDYMSGAPANTQHGQRNIPTSQPPVSFPTSQSDPYSNFVGEQPPCSSANQQYTQSSDVQTVYSGQTLRPSDFQHNQGFSQTTPSDTNELQGNQVFFRNFPIKNEPGTHPDPTNQEYPPNYQGPKPNDSPQKSVYGESNSQGYFNSPPQQQNLFRPHQEEPVNNQMDRFSNQQVQKQETVGHHPNPYSNENFVSGRENLSDQVKNQPNQMSEFGVNSQSPLKNQSDANRFGTVAGKDQQEMGQYASISQDVQHLESYPSLGKPPQSNVLFGMEGNKSFQDVSTSYVQNTNKNVPSQSPQANLGNYGQMGGQLPHHQSPAGSYSGGHKPGVEANSDSSGYSKIGSKGSQDAQMLGNFGVMGAKGPNESSGGGFNPALSIKNPQDPMLVGYAVSMSKAMDPSIGSYGSGPMGSKSSQDPSIPGSYGAGPMGGKSTQDPQIGGSSVPGYGHQMSQKPETSMQGNYSQTTMGGKNSQEPLMGESYEHMGVKNPQDPHGAGYRSASGSRDQPKVGNFKGAQQSNLAGYVPPLGSGSNAHDNNPSPYGPSSVKDQPDTSMNMGSNYGPMGAKPMLDSTGNFVAMAPRNQHDQASGMQGYGNLSGMNPQDPSDSMGNYSSFDMKNAPHDNRGGAFGQVDSRNPPDRPNPSSGSGKGQETKNRGAYSGMGNEIQQDSCGSGSYEGNTNSQKPPHGYQFNQQDDQGSHMGYGNQNLDGNSYRSSSDPMYTLPDTKNPIPGMQYTNQVPPSGNMLGSMGNRTNQPQNPIRMNQPGNPMTMSGNAMCQGNQMNVSCNQMNMPGNQMMHGNQMNQQGNSGFPNLQQNQGSQSAGDPQNTYYQNQNYNFEQPGTSFSEMKEKRGMSCQTEFDKDDRAHEKGQTEEGKRDDENKKDDEKKTGETQIAVPAGKSGKEEMGIPYDWATELLKGYIPGDIHASAKMSVFFCILEESIALGDRILLFSQSLFTLNLMEELLQRRDIPGREEKWARNLNYYRLDGSTTAIEREKLINEFNSNPKLHLFLVSTRAGSLGINLVGANRVIVFDASWNPCHDTQAVCRVYRYGQKKPCFVYRLVTDNCLEKKIYDRQINKQGMSDRVVDECNPDAHLSIKEVTSLCWDDKDDDTEVKDFTDIQDQYIDVVIQKVLQQHSKLLSKEPFQHESLLVDRKEKKLSQAEKRLAKRSYELEKQASTGTNRPLYQNNIVSTQGGIISRRGSDKPMASVRPMQSEMGSGLVRGENRQRGWIPASVWQRQGMSAQEMTLPLDVVIPTNAPDRSSIVLKAGQKVMVLKSPKGIYMQLENGKIIAIRTAFKPGNQASKDGPKKSTGAGPEALRRNVPVIPSNLRNNSAVSITPRGPASGSGTGPGRSFSQGNRPVRAVGPTHRPSPVSVTVTKKRPPTFDTSQMAALPQVPSRIAMGKSDDSDGCDSTSASPARPPPSPHHDSRDSMASSSSQFGGSYSNSSRSTPVLPSFTRDVSITPYSSKDMRGVPAGNSAGVPPSSSYRDPGSGYMGPAPRNEVSITPYSRDAMGGGQDMGRDEARKEYDGGGGSLPPPPPEYRPESRPFASVSLDSSHSYRHDPLGHGDSRGSRGSDQPVGQDPSGGDRNKRAFQPYPSAYPPPPPPMDKGSSGGPSPYSAYHMNKGSGGYDSKSQGAGASISRTPHPHHGDSSKHQSPLQVPHQAPHQEPHQEPLQSSHQSHPLYHHRPPPPHEQDTRPYRSDKPLYHPRPDTEKQFQPQEPEKSYISRQRPYMQSEKPFMQSEKPFLQSEKAHLQSDKTHLQKEKGNEKSGGFPVGAKEEKFGFDRVNSSEAEKAFPLRPEAKQAYRETPMGYATPPPAGYQAPAGYKTPPPAGYQAPAGYRSPPPAGYQAPPVGYKTPPPAGYQAPPVGYKTPPPAPLPFYPVYPPPYGPNPFTAAAVSRSSFYPPPPTYYPPFPPAYPQHPNPPPP